MRRLAPEFRPRADKTGTMRMGGTFREKLYLWPLNQDRTGLELPLLARDAIAEFGLPPHGSTWNVDHPSAMTVQLGDGRWHNVLAYRVMERGEMVRGLSPSPQTGCYLEEVSSAGEPIRAWSF